MEGVVSWCVSWCVTLCVLACFLLIYILGGDIAVGFKFLLYGIL